MSTCRTCGRPIRWAKTLATGKAIPLNPEPTPGGNLALDNGLVWYVQPSSTVALYTSHFVDCPNANGHRKERRR